VTEGKNYDVRIKKSAEKEMMDLGREDHDRISEVILRLEADPRPSGCVKLKSREGYRIRVGKTKDSVYSERFRTVCGSFRSHPQRQGVSSLGPPSSVLSARRTPISDAKLTASQYVC